MQNYRFLLLHRKQLDAKLNPDSRLRDLLRPANGWIREIRTALGMNTSQLAHRLRTTKQAVAALEQREHQGKITVESLKKAAEALDCTLVVALVPRRSLNATVTEQAEVKAREQRDRVSHTMLLEAQQAGLDDGPEGAAQYWLTVGRAHLWDAR